MPWSLSSGRRTDYVGTITGSRFEHTEFENGGSQNSIRLTFTLDDGSEWNENYSIGGKWFPSADGTMAEHEDGLTDSGEYREFNKRSKYGAFIAAALEVIPAEILMEKGDPVEAKTWLGLRLHMNEVVLKGMKNPETGDPVTMNAPVEYLGMEETADEAAYRLFDQLRAAAWEATNHNNFMEKVLHLPGVEGNNSLVMQIADPDGLYQELLNDTDRSRQAAPSS